MHTIYLIRKDGNPVYVGYTSRCIKARWQEHLSISNTIKKHKCKFPLHDAISEYGIKSFSIESLYESEDRNHTLNFMEHHFIWLYRTHVDCGGYNMTWGGEGNLSDLSKNKIIEANLIRTALKYNMSLDEYVISRQQIQKEQRKRWSTKWRLNNKEKHLDSIIKYNKSEKGKASRRRAKAAWIARKKKDIS